MKFVVVNVDNPAFLRRLYESNPGLENESFARQLEVRASSLFGTSGSYVHGLVLNGHEASEIHANNDAMQRAWAREHGVPAPAGDPGRAVSRLRRLAARPLVGRAWSSVRPRVEQVVRLPGTWRQDALAAQIEEARPDILLNLNMTFLGHAFLRRIGSSVGAIVGQIAWPPSAGSTSAFGSRTLACYSLVLSPIAATVEFFRARGVRAELQPLGFDPRVLDRVGRGEHVCDVSFVGSLGGIHSARIAFLEQVAERVPGLRIWAPDPGSLDPRSPLRRSYMGEAWGLEMYRILAGSRVTLNHHGPVEEYASNLRLFEATGAGSLLVTDWKPNLAELFEPGSEVLAYRAPSECADLVLECLGREQDRAAIAAAGRSRTLREHTYERRMAELVEHVTRRLP